MQFDAYFEEAAVKNNASWAKEESEIQQKAAEAWESTGSEWWLVGGLEHFLFSI